MKDINHLDINQGFLLNSKMGKFGIMAKIIDVIN